MPLCGSPSVKRLLFLGLDGSGKTSILTVHKDIEPEDKRPYAILPTVGVELHEFVKDGLRWRVFDLGGHGRYRASLWPRFYSKVDAIVWVVDSTDTARIGVVRDEFTKMLRHPDVVAKRVPVLVMVNKGQVGRSSVLTTDSVPKALMLDAVMLARQVKVVATDAISGAGIDDGFTWLRAVMV